MTAKNKHQYKKRSKFMISKSIINAAKKQINDWEKKNINAKNK